MTAKGLERFLEENLLPKSGSLTRLIILKRRLKLLTKQGAICEFVYLLRVKWTRLGSEQFSAESPGERDDVNCILNRTEK